MSIRRIRSRAPYTWHPDIPAPRDGLEELWAHVERQRERERTSAPFRGILIGSLAGLTAWAALVALIFWLT